MAAMNSISVEPQALRTVADQLRTIASYLEKLIPVEPDAHLPPHRRLEYVTRSRSVHVEGQKERRQVVSGGTQRRRRLRLLAPFRRFVRAYVVPDAPALQTPIRRHRTAIADADVDPLGAMAAGAAHGATAFDRRRSHAVFQRPGMRSLQTWAQWAHRKYTTYSVRWTARASTTRPHSGQGGVRRRSGRRRSTVGVFCMAGEAPYRTSAVAIN